MAEFSKLVITNKGQALIAKMIAGKGNIDFTKICTSSTTYTLEQLEALTSLSSIEQTSLISKVVRTNEVAIKVEAAFTNNELTVGYYMRTLGLYAVDPDVGEILYAVTIENSGNCYMPPYNGVTVSGAYVQLVTTVGNADNVSLEVDAAAIATIGDIQELQKDVAQAQEDISDIRGYLGYTEGHIYGVEVDFTNKVFTRLAGAVGLNAGSDFDSINAFGGRRRCNLADDGTVNAYYGDPGYKEDGSNGQVMVEQPMFYYKVVPIKLEKLSNGQMITRKVRYYVSDNFYEGFKIHPAFIVNGKICDKIYVSAYEATLYDVSASTYDLTDAVSADFSTDKICSIAGAKPASGSKNALTRANLRKLAQNRGSDWAQSLVQTVCMSELLMLIEYAQFNMQDAIGIGNSQRSWLEDGTNWAVNTGATARLGNKSGAVTITVAGQTSGAADQQVVTVSYRGEENLWADIWTWFDGINVKNPDSFGSGNFSEGVYIADHDFADDTSASPYEDSGLRLPYLSWSFISAFCYSFNYDWIFLPGEGNGNSSVPVGDIIENVNSGWRVAVLGACWDGWALAGPFCWDLYDASGDYIRNIGGRSVYRKS